MHKKNNEITDTKKHNPARQLYDESMTKVSDEAENLETIREILFGEQSRESEKRRHDAHHALQLNIAELKQDTRDQFEFLSAEINKLYKLINDENDGRLAEKKGTDQAIDKLRSSLEQAKIRQENESSKIHQQVLNESSRLEQQAISRHNELSQKLEQASIELKSDKTDRGDLAKLLQGMAEQLLDTSSKR